MNGMTFRGILSLEGRESRILPALNGAQIREYVILHHVGIAKTPKLHQCAFFPLQPQMQNFADSSKQRLLYAQRGLFFGLSFSY